MAGGRGERGWGGRVHWLPRRRIKGFSSLKWLLFPPQKQTAHKDLGVKLGRPLAQLSICAREPKKKRLTKKGRGSTGHLNQENGEGPSWRARLKGNLSTPTESRRGRDKKKNKVRGLKKVGLSSSEWDGWFRCLERPG